MLAPLFPTREVFWPLAHYLLVPTQPLYDQARAFYEQHLQGGLAVGIQVRSMKTLGRAFPPLRTFAQLATLLRLHRGMSPNATAFFIAVDNATLRGELSLLLADSGRVHWVNNDIGVAIPPGRHGSPCGSCTTPGPNPGSEEMAVVDHKLLSMCDELVVSPASSFGATAAAFGGLHAVYPTSGRRKDSERPFFWTTMTSEPCPYKVPRKWGSWSAAIQEDMRAQPQFMDYWQCHPCEGDCPDLGSFA